MANDPGDNKEDGATSQGSPAVAGGSAKDVIHGTTTNVGGGDKPPPVIPPSQGANGGEASMSNEPKEKTPSVPPPPPPPAPEPTVVNVHHNPPPQPQRPPMGEMRPMRDEDRPPRRDFGPRPREDRDSRSEGLNFTKLFAILAGIALLVILAVWLWPDSWKINSKDISYGQAAGQAQGAPSGTPTANPTTTGNGGGGNQPAPPPTSSPPPSGSSGSDLLSDSERLDGGPCKGAAVDRMNYYFLGQSKEDGQIKVGTWCSAELIVDPNQQLAVLQTAQMMGGTQDLTKLLSTIHLARLSRRYPGKETVQIKDGRLHTLVDPLIIPINGTGSNALQDVCDQFKTHPGDNASPLQLWLWKQCQDGIATKPANVQNTVISMGNYVTRPEFDQERNYTRAELKRLQDAINAAGKPLSPAEVKRVVNPHSQEQKYEPTPPQ
jgi:hypothetical protein